MKHMRFEAGLAIPHSSTRNSKDPLFGFNFKQLDHGPRSAKAGHSSPKCEPTFSHDFPVLGGASDSG